LELLLVLIDEIEVNQHLPIGKENHFYIILKIFYYINRIRTRVYAQGFVVSLLTAAAVYQAVTSRPEPHDIHGHKIVDHEKSPSSNHPN